MTDCYKPCSPYEWAEDDKIRANTDLVTLYGVCGYYGVPVETFLDAASGLDQVVRLAPNAEQTIVGDFPLNWQGSEYKASISPNRMAIESNINGGFVVTVDGNGDSTLKSKGNDIATFSNRVDMSVPIRMSLTYQSVNDKDVVVKDELNVVAAQAAGAQASADNAQTAADNAQSSADNAQTAADAAQAKADTNEADIAAINAEPKVYRSSFEMAANQTVTEGVGAD